MKKFFVGTAGWNVPTEYKEEFPTEGTHLQRYAQVLNLVEINSCFYKDHKPETYERWAASTPDNFRFSTKLSRYFTHDTQLQDFRPRLRENLAAVAQLGKKWQVLLVQMPPQLIFDVKIAAPFFAELRNIYPGCIAVEPRHISWSSINAYKLFDKFSLTKVIADPEPCEALEDLSPGKGPHYYRLHGSPKIYKSKYTKKFIHLLADEIKSHSSNTETYCIFDNSTFGFATENALQLLSNLHFSEGKNTRKSTTGFKNKSLDPSQRV